MSDHQTLKREHNKLKANFAAAKIRIERLVETIELQQSEIARLQFIAIERGDKLIDANNRLLGLQTIGRDQ